MSSAARPAIIIPAPVVMLIDTMRPANVGRRERGVSSPMTFTPFRRRLLVIMIPLTDSIERKMNREHRDATFGAYPSFRIFLAMCVQNSFVIVIFSCFNIRLKKAGGLFENFCSYSGNMDTFVQIGARPAIFLVLIV
jgi:hypothetical protein